MVPTNLLPYFDRVESGLLRSVISPCGRLVLFNYSDKCVYEGAWDEFTLSARGIVFEIASGALVARPFRKFFNLGEKFAPTLQEIKTMEESGEPRLIIEKMDGSLGILFFYANEYHMITRGSFTSDQAIKGKELLKKYESLKWLNESITYLFEIIYPDNRIVVNYHGQEKLVLLGAVLTESGLPVSDHYYHDFPVPEKYNYATIEEAIDLCPSLTKDQEGFVVWWPLKDIRVKIKGEEYLRIHKIISETSPLSLWESMINGKVPTEYLMHIPEEMRSEFESIQKILEDNYAAIYNKAHEEIKILPSTTDFKAVGLFLKDNPTAITYPKLVFPILKYKKVDNVIMDLIRPHANNLIERE